MWDDNFPALSFQSLAGHWPFRGGHLWAENFGECIRSSTNVRRRSNCRYRHRPQAERWSVLLVKVRCEDRAKRPSNHTCQLTKVSGRTYERTKKGERPRTTQPPSQTCVSSTAAWLPPLSLSLSQEHGPSTLRIIQRRSLPRLLVKR